MKKFPALLACAFLSPAALTPTAVLIGHGSADAAGSTFEDFASVWAEFSNAAVDSAAPGTNERLGETTVSPVPEPSVALLGALALLTLSRRRRA